MRHRVKDAAFWVLFWIVVAGFLISVMLNRAGDLIYAVYRRKAK